MKIILNIVGFTSLILIVIFVDPVTDFIVNITHPKEEFEIAEIKTREQTLVNLLAEMPIFAEEITESSNEEKESEEDLETSNEYPPILNGIAVYDENLKAYTFTEEGMKKYNLLKTRYPSTFELIAEFENNLLNKQKRVSKKYPDGPKDAICFGDNHFYARIENSHVEAVSYEICHYLAILRIEHHEGVIKKSAAKKALTQYYDVSGYRVAFGSLLYRYGPTILIRGGNPNSKKHRAIFNMVKILNQKDGLYKYWDQVKQLWLTAQNCEFNSAGLVINSKDGLCRRGIKEIAQIKNDSIFKVKIKNLKNKPAAKVQSKEVKKEVKKETKVQKPKTLDEILATL